MFVSTVAPLRRRARRSPTGDAFGSPPRACCLRGAARRPGRQSLTAADVSVEKKTEITDALTDTLVDVLTESTDVASVNVLAVVEGLKSTTADAAAVTAQSADKVLSGLG